MSMGICLVQRWTAQAIEQEQEYKMDEHAHNMYIHLLPAEPRLMEWPRCVCKCCEAV